MQECFAMLHHSLPTADVNRPPAGQLAHIMTFASLHWNEELLFAYGLMWQTRTKARFWE